MRFLVLAIFLFAAIVGVARFVSDDPSIGLRHTHFKVNLFEIPTFGLYSEGQHVKHVANLPDTSDLAADGHYYDLGYLHHTTELFFAPIAGTIGGYYVLYSETAPKKNMMGISDEQAQKIAAKFDIALPQGSPVSNFDLHWGLALFVGALIFVIFQKALTSIVERRTARHAEENYIASRNDNFRVDRLVNQVNMKNVKSGLK